MNALVSRRLTMFVLALAQLSVLGLPGVPAWGWGGDGPRTVGAIADRVLAGTPTEVKVRALLQPGETLSSIAVWADCAKGYTYCHAPLTKEMKDFADQNKRHHNYHYTDVPFQVVTYQKGAVGTDPDDVVQILSQAIGCCAARIRRTPTRTPTSSRSGKRCC